MEYISIFEMLKIGVGPSSSHTLGPWKAALQWIDSLKEDNLFTKVDEIVIDLYGSLSLTGIGHATDLAILLGMSGMQPETIPVEDIDGIIAKIKKTGFLVLNKTKPIVFNFEKQIIYNKEFLKHHANGLKFTAFQNGEIIKTDVFYSVGGGFVVHEKEINQTNEISNEERFPYPIHKAAELEEYCADLKLDISGVVLLNEKSLKTDKEIDFELQKIWNVMLECMYIGCHTQGILPGGLNVTRRAFNMNKKLIGEKTYDNPQEWLGVIRKTKVHFRQILQWVSCFALAVNEVNASLGRVVTAPTNGSAGVIPAVLMYYLVIENHEADFEQIKKFLLVSGEIGSIVKKSATISAAMGGCQAEIGVSSAMAAGALTELLGGTPAQVLVAAEIAMEHHLGLTCDPIGGLVQIPCIERNTMGAIKAINAAELALTSSGKDAKVPFDSVVETMWKTAVDMNSKYKETSEGGLAVSVNIADC